MRKQIVVSLILIVIGVLLGFFVVVNWQLAQEIGKTQTALAQDSQRLDAIEKYLNDSFAPAGTQQ
jgi:predicted PurR-regulated permease PerM